jgi:hypothetical protein
MDTSIETLMRQYSETTRDILIYETSIERKNEEIDALTRKIRPKKWLNKVDVNDEMFKMYVLKMRLIEEYDDCIKRLEKYKATQSILLNLIKDKEYRM